MAKKKSKIDQITAFIKKNPEADWHEAKRRLPRLTITTGELCTARKRAGVAAGNGVAPRAGAPPKKHKTANSSNTRRNFNTVMRVCDMIGVEEVEKMIKLYRILEE